MNAAKQLAPGSISAQIGAMGTALSKGKSSAEGQEGREQLWGRRFSWLKEENCQHWLCVLLA